MDEKDWIGYWQEQHREVFFVGPPSAKLRATPGTEHLDRLEQILSVELPMSYRAFVRVFGPGRVSQSIAVFAPGFKGAHVIDFLGNNKWQGDQAYFVDNSLSCETGRFRSLIAFADLANQPFVWDTKRQTGGEYSVHYLPGDSSESLIDVCDSFASFIQDWCFTRKYWTLLGGEQMTSWEDEETGETCSMKCFFPIGQAPVSNV